MGYSEYKTKTISFNPGLVKCFSPNKITKNLRLNGPGAPYNIWLKIKAHVMDNFYHF